MKRKVWIPEVLKQCQRGTLLKVWVFLLLNQPNSFTAKEISRHLNTSLITIQLTLKKLRAHPEIESENVKPWRGRPEKKYRFKQEYTFE